ncbi:sugar ABC transporter substrate-binding protein [Microbacterium sp. NPDC055910]|uniref:sugar ABC transporter substrate-binding protein n=1 Tax=Microbacterium sp. NPDC055910 TaxID=3345659 RepID=UPI0035DA5CF0
MARLTHRRWTVTAAMTLAAGIALAGCSVSSTPAGEGTTAPGADSDGTYVVGISGANYAIEGARAQYEALAAGLIEAGIEVKFLDAALDINAQVSQVDQFIDQGVDAIVLNLAGDPNAIQGSLQRATDAGIDLYSIGGTGNDDVLVQVDLPSTELGELSGHYMCEQTGGTGEIALIEAVDIPVLAERWDAFLNTIEAECPDLEIVARERAIPDDAATARPIAEDLLTRFPNLTAMWTMGDGPALGAGLAVQASGRDVIVTGLNAESQGIDGIRQGAIHATWDLEPTEIGLQLADRIIAIVDGSSPRPTQTEVFTVTDLAEWTTDNVDDWVAYDARVTFPGIN